MLGGTMLKNSARKGQWALASILVMSLSLATVGGVFASSTTKTLSTNFTLINLGTATANVSVSYYLDTGAAWAADAANTSFTVAGNGGQAIIRQYTDATMISGKGSAVVSSDQPLGSVVQILARNQTPTSGAYVGSSVTDSTYYVPLALRQLNSASGLSNSQIMIQNADATAVNVNVQFIHGSGSPGADFLKSFTNIPVGSTKYYDLADEISSNLADGWFGSAVVTETGAKKIVVISNLFSGANTLQTYNAFPASRLASDWFVPLFTSRLTNGLSTPVSVQNLTGGTLNASQVTLTCTKDAASGGTNFTASNTASAVNNGLVVFNPVTDLTLQGNWYGSCKVHAPGNVAVFVQMRQPNVSENAAAYEGIPATGTNTIVLVPLVAKRLTNGFATAVTIQNLNGSTAATVNLLYVPGVGCLCGGNVSVNGLSIPAGGSLIRNHRLASGPGAETALPDNWFGTLTVTSTGGTPPAIDGFVQLTNTIPQAGDTFMAHGAFTQP
jgi:hypothetical protein